MRPETDTPESVLEVSLFRPVCALPLSVLANPGFMAQYIDNVDKSPRPDQDVDPWQSGSQWRLESAAESLAGSHKPSRGLAGGALALAGVPTGLAHLGH